MSSLFVFLFLTMLSLLRIFLGSHFLDMLCINSFFSNGCSNGFMILLFLYFMIFPSFVTIFHLAYLI
ncbi:hypothetical protein GIB67_019227 [Kingdonia uniflora]|uniref:Uncharacterized protein n=1 Tax=Kingdonia uniflora TaxID=39325 RepID=A0A7J7N0J4_9MAGN|nr:hypothetical protein GIB67_019227 [Kingdonia uniflora]